MKEYISEYEGFQIKPDKTYPSSYRVVTAGRGGKIPDILDGLFTSRGIAMTMIDKYRNDKKKDVKNAETNSPG